MNIEIPANTEAGNIFVLLAQTRKICKQIEGEYNGPKFRSIQGKVFKSDNYKEAVAVINEEIKGHVQFVLVGG